MLINKLRHITERFVFKITNGKTKYISEEKGITNIILYSTVGVDIKESLLLVNSTYVGRLKVNKRSICCCLVPDCGREMLF